MSRTTTKMGLTSWNEGDDNYSYEQLANNWQLIDFHDHTPGRGVPVAPGGLASGAVLQQNIAAGVIGIQHLSTQLTKDLGLGTNGRGSVQVAGATSITTTSITVPDQVMSLNVDAGSLVGITYQALAKVSSGGSLNAAICTSLNPSGSWAATSIATNNGAPSSGPEVQLNNTYFTPIATNGVYLVGGNSTTADSTESTTPQLVGFAGNGTVGGGETLLFFNTAGSYNIGVGYWLSATGYTITVQNRHLWARTINFE